MLALLLLAPLTEVNGDQALAAVKRTLSEFGYSQPVRLQKLNSYQAPNQPKTKYWSVELTGKGRFSATAHVRADDGRVVGFSVSRPHGDFTAPEPNDPILRRRADEIVRRLRGPHQVRFESLGRDKPGNAFAVYKLLIDGHPFVGSYTRAGYGIGFDAKTKRLVNYTIVDRPAPIDPRPARLTKAQAEAAVRKYIAETFIPQTKKWGGTVGATKFLGLEFGYHQVEGEPMARRVWKGEFSANVTHPRRLLSGRQTVLIDAITGAIVPYGGY